MAKLTADARRKLKKKMFAMPGSRRFPINDATHARMAISGATRSFHAGNISEEEMGTIKTKARRKLGDEGGA